MTDKLHRFTISIPPKVKEDLDMARKEHYDEMTQKEMLRDLIARGLKTLKEEKPVNAG